jgi:hypothetical protein
MMHTGFKRLSAAAALIAPIAMMSISTAPASAAEGTTCTGNSGSAKFSPGLTSSAKVQNVIVKGTLSGCSGGGVSGGSYIAHLKTTNAVSCAALAGPGEPATGTVVIKWSPKGQGNSNGTFSMPLTGVPGVSLAGTLESGPFATMSLSGTVSQTFSGTCGAAVGKKKAKAVKDSTFTGSAVTIA